MRFAFLLLFAVLIGCSNQQAPRSRTVHDFAFITSSTTLGDVTRRMGTYDRVSGSGIQMFEYDLADGSKIVLWPDWRYTGTNLIHRVARVAGTNYTDLMRVTR